MTTKPDALSPLSLWYREPADKWVEALPVGNGRLGAMIFGSIPSERIQFNEDTVWTGSPHDYAHPGAAAQFPALRDMTLDMLAKQRQGQWEEAEAIQQRAQDLASESFMSQPLGQKSYQPVGDLAIDFSHEDEISNYVRWLDLDCALAGVSYQCAGVAYERQLFASHPDDAIVTRLTASRPGALSFTARLESPHVGFQIRPLSESQLLLTGQVEADGIRFAAQLVVLIDAGEFAATSAGIAVTGATEATLYLVAASSYIDYRDISADPEERCRDSVELLLNRNYADLEANHVADHQSLFHRVHLDLGTGPTAALSTLDRLTGDAKEDDPQLATLYFQFGRYLLIASSRPGSQPANLQGIWNDRLDPPWDSKWTVNINTEMNYWPAEVTNLSECHQPIFDMLEEVAVTGSRVAREHYDARGWVLHHNTDIWRGAAPINASNHGIWPTGGAWLCQHLWWHYAFTGDREFLAWRVYPLLREASLFFVDLLTEEPQTGWLVSPLSNSPEIGGLVAGPTMDHQIIRALLTRTPATKSPNTRPNCSPPPASPSSFAATRGPAGPWAGRSTSGPASKTATTPSKCWRDSCASPARRAPNTTAAAPIPTCSTPTPPSRSTATSAPPRASPKCCSSRTPVIWNSCPPYRRNGPRGKSGGCAPAAALSSTFNGPITV